MSGSLFSHAKKTGRCYNLMAGGGGQEGSGQQMGNLSNSALLLQVPSIAQHCPLSLNSLLSSLQLNSDIEAMKTNLDIFFLVVNGSLIILMQVENKNNESK